MGRMSFTQELKAVAQQPSEGMCVGGAAPSDALGPWWGDH